MCCSCSFSWSSPLVMILVNAFLDADNTLTLENFKDFFTDKSSLIILANSLLVGVITTAICLIIGYPLAYILSKMPSGRVLVLFYVLPMWVNFLIRTLATKAIFIAIDVPLGMGTVIFGMVYNYLPFMILPLHTTLSSIDPQLHRGGAGPRRGLFDSVPENGAASVRQRHHQRHHDGVHPHHLHLRHLATAVQRQDIPLRWTAYR